MLKSPYLYSIEDLLPTKKIAGVNLTNLCNSTVPIRTAIQPNIYFLYNTWYFFYLPEIFYS